jgi:hypothetical protein
MLAPLGYSLPQGLIAGHGTHKVNPNPAFSDHAFRSSIIEPNLV